MSYVKPLWEFSCEYYQLPKVETICLQLQDSHDIEIPALLFCIWVGHFYGLLKPEAIQYVVEIAEEKSHLVIRPLREIRRQMKRKGYEQGTEWADIRQQVKALELQSEKRLLQDLESTFKVQEVCECSHLTALTGNIEQYLRLKGRAWAPLQPLLDELIGQL